jgi:hypothetical protein
VPKVYIYKLTVDDGGAPCVSKGILSLAICKPAIRSTAERGNIILGFAANDLYKDNALVYMATVTKKLEGRDYFSKPIYAGRPDCIYEWDGGSFEWKSGSKFHSPFHSEHDLGEAPGYIRAHVLLSEGAENFRYFGAECPIDYKQDYLRLKSLVEELGQGHRVNFDSALRGELSQFITRLCGTPSTYRATAAPGAPCHDKCNHTDKDFVAIDC